MGNKKKKKDPAKDSLRVSRAPSDDSDPDGQQQKQLSKKAQKREKKRLEQKNKAPAVPEKAMPKATEDLDDSYEGRKGLNPKEEKSAKKRSLKQQE